MTTPRKADVSLTTGSNNTRVERSTHLFAPSQESAQRRYAVGVYTLAEQKRRREARRRRTKQAAETGGVYFVEAVGLKKVKIGYAAEPRKRLAALATASPVPLRMVAFVRGPRALEFTLHMRFFASHSHGEWFHIRKALAAFIEQHSAQNPAQDDPTSS